MVIASHDGYFEGIHVYPTHAMLELSGCDERLSNGQANYFLVPHGFTLPHKTVFDFGCQVLFLRVKIVNTHNGPINDRYLNEMV